MKAAIWDRLILVDNKKFIECIDKDDLDCRQSRIVENAYHKDWFYESNGYVYFELPVIQIIEGRVTFINGRHRTVLLSRYLEFYPIAVGSIDAAHVFGMKSPKSMEIYSFKDQGA